MTIPKLSPGWEYKRLDELGFVRRGKSKHRPRNDTSLYGGEYPFVQTGEIKAADLYISEYAQTYNEKGLAQSKLWEPGTLCITIAANVAETAILKIRACFPDSIVGFTADPEKSDVRFVKYYLDTLKLQMQSISRGTTQDNLPVEKLLSFKLIVPQPNTQRKIAAILSAYDDLIENNIRRIKILEEMAQMFYHEWFVNFRFPGHEKVKMVNSRLGKVPEGWEIKKLGDVIELAYGKGLKADQRKEGNVPVFGSGGLVGYHNQCLVHGPGIIVGRKGNVGSVYWCEIDFFPIDTVFYVVSKLPLHFVYYNLKGQNFINNDAAVPGLNRNQAYLNQIVVPQSSILEQFENIVTPIFLRVRNLELVNGNLRRTRDLLLPKLISGEVDVEDLDINTRGLPV